jgi:hypothetical protein
MVISAETCDVDADTIEEEGENEDEALFWTRSELPAPFAHRR